jgi:hypothetical protein
LRDSPSDESPWLRWLVPPVRELIFGVLLFSLCFGSLAGRVLRDGGTGWHIRTGQLILSTHSIPRTDPFSLSTAGKPWYAWEWLYEVGLGAICNLAGLNGAVAATGLLVAVTFAWLFQIMRRRGSDLLTAIVFLLLALGAAAIHLYVRPHVVSWLLTLAWWQLLETARENDDPKNLAWLPALMVLWVNVHGGFLFGLMLLGVYDLEAAWRMWGQNEEPSRRWLRGMALATLASALATLANPYGYHLHIHIYKYLTDSFLMKHIQEFQPPNFHGFSEIFFAVLLALGLGGVALARKKPSLREYLVLLLSMWAGFYASRNLPVSSILIAAIAAPFLSRAWQERVRGEGAATTWASILDRLGRRDAALPGGLSTALIVGLVLWAATHSGTVGQWRLMDAQFDSSRFPVAAFSSIVTRGIGDPIFSTDQWGGYLIYRKYPSVLVDDRHDLYGDEFFRQYLKIVHVEPGWQEALNQTRARVVLMPVGSALPAALHSEPGWSEVYRDKVAAVLERKY